MLRKAGDLIALLKGVPEAVLIADLYRANQGIGGLRLYGSLPELFDDAVAHVKEAGSLPTPARVRDAARWLLETRRSQAEDLIGIEYDRLGLTLPEVLAEQAAQTQRRPSAVGRQPAYDPKTDPYADTPF